METTPTKAKSGTGAVPPSPGTKRTLEFDFLAEMRNKVPKIIQEDLEYCKLEDLKVARSFEKAVKVKCVGVMSGSSFFKAALQDNTGLVTAVAFGDKDSKLAASFQVGKWYTVANFSVKRENPSYLSGAVKDLQIIMESVAVFVEVLTDEMELDGNFRTVEEMKSLPDNTLADLTCVCVEEWGQSETSGGLRTEIAVMDQSNSTIKLTLWGEKGNQLVGVKFKVLKFTNVAVTSLGGIKCLTSRWFTDLLVAPETDESREMAMWFQNLLSDANTTSEAT